MTTEYESVMLYYYEHLLLLDLAFPGSVVDVRSIGDMDTAFVVELYFTTQQAAESFRTYSRVLDRRRFDIYTYGGPQHSSYTHSSWGMRVRCNTGVAAVAKWFVAMGVPLEPTPPPEVGQRYIEELSRILSTHGFKDTKHPNRRDYVKFRYDPPTFNFYY